MKNSEQGKGFKGRRGRFRGRGRGHAFQRPTSGHKLIMLTIDLRRNTSNYLQFRAAFIREAKKKLREGWSLALEDDKLEPAPIKVSRKYNVVYESDDEEVEPAGVKAAGGSGARKAADDSKKSKKDDDDADDEDDFDKLVRKELAKGVAHHILSDVDKSKEFYGTIMTYLSTGSEAVIKAHEKYIKAHKNQDLLLLWRIIKETHSTHMQGGNAFDRNRLAKEIHTIRQDAHEDLADYRKRFEDKHFEAESLGCYIGTMEDQVTRFVESLNEAEFGAYKTFISNDLKLKEEGATSTLFPKDLDTAVKQATKYAGVTTAVIPDKDYSAVFSARGGRGGRGNRGGRGGRGGRGQGNRDTSKEETSSSQVRKGKCFVCGEPGHWAKECEYNKDIDGSIEEEFDAQHTEKAKPSAGGGRSGGGVAWGDAGGKKANLSILIAKTVALTVKQRSLVCLDTCANINIMCNSDLCVNVGDNSDTDWITGIEGSDFVPRSQAVFTDLDLEVKLDARAQANILSFSILREKYQLRYDAYYDQFEVLKPPLVFVFENYDGIYARDFSERAKAIMYKTMISTVEGNEALYTPREVKAAKGVREFMIVRGLTSDSEMIRMIKSGGILNCPYTIYDVHRARKIYGPDIATLKGKQKRSKPFAPKRIEEPWRPLRMAQTLCIDLFQICGLWFFLSLSLPLGLLMITYLPTDKKLGGVWKALMSHVAAYKSRMFAVSTVRSDQEGAVVALKEKINERSIELELTSRSQHVGPIENAIGRVKARARGIMAELPYRLCKILVIYLAGYCVVRVNQSLYDKTPGALCPFSNFKLRKLDADIDYRIGFGNYTQVHEERENTATMEPRTTGAISLCPTGNLTGSQKFLSLSTKRVITRDKWTTLPIPQSVINKLNKWAEKDNTPIPSDVTFQYRGKEVSILVDTEPVEQPVQEVLRRPEEARAAVEDAEAALQARNELDEAPVEVVPSEEPGEEPSDGATSATGEEEHKDEGEINEVVAEEVEEAEAVGEAEVDDGSVSDSNCDTEQEEETHLPPRREGLRERPQRSFEQYRYQDPERLARSKLGGGKALFTRVTSNRHNGRQLSAYHISVKEALRKFSKSAIKSIVKEVINVYGQGKNITPIRAKDLTYKQMKGMIRSMIFLKDKYLPTGEFEKLKARLVALGNFQDQELYSDQDKASPTVSLLSLMALVTKSHAEGRVFKTVDIPGAYLKADIGDKEVIMKLDKLVSYILIKIDPTVEPYVNESGEIVVKLNKALYGCVQSALQWYKEISGYLVSIGFQINKMDPCVFNKTDLNGKQLTIVVHVDDLMFMGEENAINIAINQLRDKYGEVTVHEGKVLPYLGMVFNFSRKDKVLISMDKYTEDLLRLYEVKGKAKTPALPNLFQVDDTSSLLCESEREMFHSRVAKLLYLAKRCRPDILPAIIFLTGRVQCATEEDWGKLNRVLYYLNYCPTLGIGLNATSLNTIFGYIDVSFASEVDYKSRTGVIISLGNGPVYAESSRQKINTTGSSEAELVGCSDGSKNIIWLRNFFIEQGYKVVPAKIYQDNKSTLALLKNGRSTAKSTRHINIRYFFLKDRIDSGEIELEYLPTDEMIADILTKPLQGRKFQILRDRLLNYN